jgi:hypothetical protein
MRSLRLPLIVHCAVAPAAPHPFAWAPAPRCRHPHLALGGPGTANAHGATPLQNYRPLRPGSTIQGRMSPSPLHTTPTHPIQFP